jgi:hypothetical protein
MAQDTVQWRILMNMTMNVWVPQTVVRTGGAKRCVPLSPLHAQQEGTSPNGHEPVGRHNRNFINTPYEYLKQHLGKRLGDRGIGARYRAGARGKTLPSARVSSPIYNVYGVTSRCAVKEPENTEEHSPHPDD